MYSLKEGINDGFLTPFKVKQIASTLDEYLHVPGDGVVVKGEVEAGRRYLEGEFNRVIKIPEREAYRVRLFMQQINPNDKTLVFCANQQHALEVRDLINQNKRSREPDYCVRVTAADGARGEEYLRYFQDNEKHIPTILTTSQKLSTGVDARNVRNIVLLRPVTNMIEFKQIIGRGTRLFDGKDYFTVYDFVKAHHLFSDPEWDGEPEEPAAPGGVGTGEEPGGYAGDPQEPKPPRPPRPAVVEIKLSNGSVRRIRSMMATLFLGADGRPMSAAQFLENLFGNLPEFFKDEDELCSIWSAPDTRKVLLQGLAERGFSREVLVEMQSIIDAENSDLFDVLSYVAFASDPLTREERASKASSSLHGQFSSKQEAFIDFVLAHYVKEGVDELDGEKISPLLKIKYNNAIADAVADLGKPELIKNLFFGFQKYLYQEPTRQNP